MTAITFFEANRQCRNAAIDMRRTNDCAPAILVDSDQDLLEDGPIESTRDTAGGTRPLDIETPRAGVMNKHRPIPDLIRRAAYYADDEAVVAVGPPPDAGHYVVGSCGDDDL